MVEQAVLFPVVVRILSGAAVLDLFLIWNLAKSTVFQVYADTVGALLDKLRFSGFQSSEKVFRKISFEYCTSRKAENPPYGSIGAFNGVAIRIRKPRRTDCADPATIIVKASTLYLIKPYVMPTTDLHSVLPNARAVHMIR